MLRSLNIFLFFFVVANSLPAQEADTRPDAWRNLTKDSIIHLLTHHRWTSCGSFDSITQYRHIQFINKDLLKGGSNCSADWAAASEWTFSNDPENRSLTISNQVGWNAPDEFQQASIAKWEWEYNNEEHLLYLANSRKKSYRLLITYISANSLVLTPVTW